jgi:hypothetical protein
MKNLKLNVDFFFSTEEENKEMNNFYEKNKNYFNLLKDNKDEKKKIKEDEEKKNEKEEEEIILQINVLTESFFIQKNVEKFFGFLDDSYTNLNSNCFSFKSFKKYVENRILNITNENKKNKKIRESIKKINFDFKNLIKFENYEKFKIENFLLNEKEEKEFNNNFKIIENCYFKEQEKQKKISKIFINEILVEIIKFIDLKTLINTVLNFFKFFFFLIFF